MHRHAFAALSAVLALSGCQKSSPTPIESPKVLPLVPSASLPPSPATVLDAGEVSPARRTPVLALAHAHLGSTDHLARARVLRDDGDPVEALAEARRQLADVADDEEALTLVSRLAQSLGQRALAAVAFEHLAAVHEDDAGPLIQAARMHLVLGETVDAARLASAALGRDEGNVEGHQVLGRAALVEGDLRRAIDWLEQARELAPAHGWVLNNLGFAYLRANENARALETLERAAELLPMAAVVQNNLGVALERMGNKDEASAAFERSAVLAPRYIRAQVNRARMAMLNVADGGTAGEPDADADEDSGAE
jgi:tetratricopeptide (TPR) repeat protein